MDVVRSRRYDDVMIVLQRDSRSRMKRQEGEALHISQNQSHSFSCSSEKVATSKRCSQAERSPPTVVHRWTPLLHTAQLVFFDVRIISMLIIK